MKKLLLSSVALLGLTATALAADLPRRTVVAPAPVPFVAVPVFTWTGFYVGVNAGYGFTDDTDDHFNNGFGGFGGFGGSNLSVQTNAGLQPVVPLSGFNNGFGSFDNGRNRDGFTGGGQIGYNFQFTPGSGFVFGIEADIQYTDFGRNRDDDFFNNGFGGFGSNNGIFTAVPVGPIAPGSGIAGTTGVGPGALGNVALFNNGLNGFGNGFNRNDMEWFATVRGRLGYAIDRLLIYGTGGVAFKDDDNGDDFNGFGFGTGIANGASLVGTGFFANTIVGGTPAARAANLAAVQAAGATVAPTNTFGFFDDRNNNNVGFAVGGGLEYAFTNNLTFKIEGLFVSFDEDRHHNGFGFGGGNVVGVSNTGAAVVDNGFVGIGDNRRENDFAVVRAGLNFKFTSF